MATQRELFETNQTTWVQRVRLSIPTALRQEVLALLAQMARAAIGRRQPAEGDKEVSDE
jgi:hypothetical protein